MYIDIFKSACRINSVGIQMKKISCQNLSLNKQLILQATDFKEDENNSEANRENQQEKQQKINKNQHEIRKENDSQLNKVIVFIAS